MGHVDDQDLIPLRPAFDVVRRGYDRAQVDDRIEELQADLRIALADSEAGAAQAAELAYQLEIARQELDEARRELVQLAAPPDTVEGLSARLQRMLRQAQDEAAEILTRAEAVAAKRLAEAEDQAGDLRTRYQEMITETQQRRAQMEAEHESVMGQARQQAEELVTRARKRAAELEAEAAAARRQVEEDFDITMAARRREAAQALADQEARSKAEAQRRIDEADRRIDEATEVARRVVSEADQRATAMLAEATRGVEQLRMLRRQIAEQLLAVRSSLDHGLQQLEPLPGEDSTGGTGGTGTGGNP